VNKEEISCESTNPEAEGSERGPRGMKVDIIAQYLRIPSEWYSNANNSTNTCLGGPSDDLGVC